MNRMKQKKLFTCLLLILSAIGISAQPQPSVYSLNLDYFLPQGSFTYNEKIPVPKSVLGFELGQQHVDWGQVVDYMNTLAESSSRVSVKETGRTYQHRPFVEVIITSSENQKKLESLRNEHLKLSDASTSASLDKKKMPVVISLIYSIHGNEPSGVNSSLATAYFWAAAQGEQIDDILDKTIIVMTPGANPDGINRFASWVNTSRSLTDVSDDNSREFNEAWPSSRTNHYWADCNRDLLMAQHPEGVNGLNNYFEWLPNIVVDQHEQGVQHPFYFSPGDARRTHPFTPQLNQTLTSEISSYCAKELDKIGTAYYSKEDYDDYYYGKAAAYGDIHGSICLLYEEGTTRGHLRNTMYGLRTFAWTIRNQALASYGTILAGYNMREKLLDYQSDFFRKTADDSHKYAVKGYVFDTRGSKSIAYHFLKNMQLHHVDVYHLAKDYKSFKKENAYVIPLEQKYPLMVRTLMEDCKTFTDSIFYDISTWTFTHAYNLNYTTVQQTKDLLGDKVAEVVFPAGRIIGGKSDYGYVFDNQEFYTPKLIYELEENGVVINVCSKPYLFQSGDVEKQMGYGSLLVMANNQTVGPAKLYAMIDSLSAICGVDVYAAKTGLMKDVDFGSPSYSLLHQPKVALLTGRGMGIPESGEIWYLLDKRFQMCPTLIEGSILHSKELKKYNVIIAANGIPKLSDLSETSLLDWMHNGGTLIATGEAYKWAERMSPTEFNVKKVEVKRDSTAYASYSDKEEAEAGVDIPGTILKCHLDKSHPLAWGLNQDEIAVLKDNNLIFKKNSDPYISPLYYEKTPLLSGYLSNNNKKLISGTPSAFAEKEGNGCLIIFADDMNFRSYWFGTSKIFMNAIFFHECIK